MSDPVRHEDQFEFSPQSDRVSLRAKLVYDLQTDRLGYALRNTENNGWSTPTFRHPLPGDRQYPVTVPDHELAIIHNDTFDSSGAIAQLIREARVFHNYRRYVVNDFGWDPPPAGTEQISDHPTMVVFVNCSDVFAWGTSDAEPIRSEFDLKRLVAHLRRDPVYGALKWACQIRNEQPQTPWVMLLKRVGAWTPLLDRLPPNRYDALRSGKPE